MTEQIKDLIQKVRDGQLDPKQAVEKFEAPGEEFDEIEEDKDAQALKTEFRFLEKPRYFRANRGEFVVMASRPGMGKTALACQIAFNVSKYGTVLLFSLEMSKGALKRRMRQYIGLPRKGKLYVDDSKGLTINDITSRTLGYTNQHKLDLVVIDYVQIIKSQGRSKKEELAHICETLVDLASQIHCPILALAQLNRGIESREDELDVVVPRMSDIADAADIEHWADTIIILHRDPNRERDADVGAHVVKARHSYTKDFVLSFDGKNTRFTEHEEEI